MPWATPDHQNCCHPYSWFHLWKLCHCLNLTPWAEHVKGVNQFTERLQLIFSSWSLVILLSILSNNNLDQHNTITLNDNDCGRECDVLDCLSPTGCWRPLVALVVLVVLVHWRCHYQILAPALQISHHTLPTGDWAKRTIVLWKCSLRLIIRIKAIPDWSRGRWCFLVSAEMTQGPKVSLHPLVRYKWAHQMGSRPINAHYWRSS